ncbi:hypothetical protein [Flavobacterium sp.]|uniref:hypothetical protein n=1 Tax=Flavobacterium sp. TaxID=239 RepID=UPI002631EE3B|nr:hypothetical protein [Flavobacterium sp.]
MKNAVYSLIYLLFFANVNAVNISSAKDLIPITITMNDGQIKKGSVNNKFDPEKKITLILDDGNEETLASGDVKAFTITNPDGALITYENVPYYKNNRKDIAAKPMFMMVIMPAPSPLIMYYRLPWKVAYGAGAAASMYNTTDFYAKRDGEPAATLLSSVMQGQVNPNSVFIHAAPQYFSDYPALAKKIENKTYTYAEIMNVAIEYVKWKVGEENFKEVKK